MIRVLGITFHNNFAVETNCILLENIELLHLVRLEVNVNLTLLLCTFCVSANHKIQLFIAINLRRYYAVIFEQN